MEILEVVSKKVPFLGSEKPQNQDRIPSYILRCTESLGESPSNQFLMRKPIIIVVGGTKVSGQVYDLADHNISIGNQPHSEVAALVIFLESWFGPIDEYSRFTSPELRVIPSAVGKTVINDEEE